MKSLLPEKLRKLGSLPMSVMLRLFTRLRTTDSDESPTPVYRRHLPRALEKSRRRMRKASQRRNREN